MKAWGWDGSLGPIGQSVEMRGGILYWRGTDRPVPLGEYVEGERRERRNQRRRKSHEQMP